MIEKLLEDIGLKSSTCLEFGAWDGKHLSNTWTLWAERGWDAVLIEADRHRFELLKKCTENKPNVMCLCAQVGTDPESSLDQILAQSQHNMDVGVLSIDIDGDDYIIWESTALKAAIVVIEYNASFPPEITYVAKPGTHSGSSAAAFIALAERKGYDFVDLTKTNLLFIRSDLTERLTVERLALIDAFDRDLLPVVYSDIYGIHRLLRPAQWGFSGFRAEIGLSAITGRSRHSLVRSAKWLARMNVPVISSSLRHGANWFAYRSLKKNP